MTLYKYLQNAHVINKSGATIAWDLEHCLGIHVFESFINVNSAASTQLPNSLIKMLTILGVIDVIALRCTCILFCMNKSCELNCNKFD